MLHPEFPPSLLDCAPDASVVIGESGTILFANEQAEHLLGYASGELHGQSVEMFLPERLRMPHIGHRLRFTDDCRMRPMGAGRALFALCKDGSKRPVEIGLSLSKLSCSRSVEPCQGLALPPQDALSTSLVIGCNWKCVAPRRVLPVGKARHDGSKTTSGASGAPARSRAKNRGICADSGGQMVVCSIS
jgi:PAS domain S-box-containing protein